MDLDNTYDSINWQFVINREAMLQEEKEILIQAFSLLLYQIAKRHKLQPDEQFQLQVNRLDFKQQCMEQIQVAIVKTKTKLMQQARMFNDIFQFQADDSLPEDWKQILEVQKVKMRQMILEKRNAIFQKRVTDEMKKLLKDQTLELKEKLKEDIVYICKRSQKQPQELKEEIEYIGKRFKQPQQKKHNIAEILVTEQGNQHLEKKEELYQKRFRKIERIVTELAGRGFKKFELPKQRCQEMNSAKLKKRSKSNLNIFAKQQLYRQTNSKSKDLIRRK